VKEDQVKDDKDEHRNECNIHELSLGHTSVTTSDQFFSGSDFTDSSIHMKGSRISAAYIDRSIFLLAGNELKRFCQFVHVFLLNDGENMSLGWIPLVVPWQADL
jgi:hypothetical protein